MQSKREIAIFSKGNAHPLHPRIALEIDVLEANGYEVKLFTPQENKLTLKARLLNILSLSLFKWELIFEFSKQLNHFETVIVYDTQLLPLGRFKGWKNKQLIFETLDDNVELVTYHIFSKFPGLKMLESSCRNYLKKKENYYLKNYFNNTIVNSKRLRDIFENHGAVLNYYSSPFEKNEIKKCEIDFNPALLYLGKISRDKGLKSMLELAKQHQIKLFLFGDLDKEEAEDLKQEITAYEGVHQINKLSIKELLTQITTLAESHHLIGLSLIKPVHISYQFQDANKDIDYLALNIPFIGNSRPTTKQIIDDGCGALIEHSNEVKLLINSKEKYELASSKCATHYQSHFSQAQFAANLLGVLK